MNARPGTEISSGIMSPDDVETWNREEFIAEAWDYHPGQHVTIIGPNGRGKTTLGLQLLDASATDTMKAFVLVSKPRDATFEKWRKKPGVKFIENYPPSPEPRFGGLRKKFTRIYFLKPYQSLKDLDGDDARLRREFRECMLDSYATPKPRIIFADEVQELQNDLGLKKECTKYWKRGRSLDSGLWALAQRSAFNVQDMYNAAEHLFLFNDPDRRNRQRYAEIGGVDPDLVEEITNTLDSYQALYIRRTGPAMCIVNP